MKIDRHGIKEPPPELLAMEAKGRDIARLLAGVLPPGIGFTLMLYDFGEGGFTTYLSNARRDDMVRMLKETLGKLETACQ